MMVAEQFHYCVMSILAKFNPNVFSLFFQVTITVNIIPTNVNDNPPRFSKSLYLKNLSEVSKIFSECIKRLRIFSFWALSSFYNQDHWTSQRNAFPDIILHSINKFNFAQLKEERLCNIKLPFDDD